MTRTLPGNKTCHILITVMILVTGYRSMLLSGSFELRGDLYSFVDMYLENELRAEFQLSLKSSFFSGPWEFHGNIRLNEDSSSRYSHQVNPDFAGDERRSPRLHLGEFYLQRNGHFWELALGKIHLPGGVAEINQPTEFIQPRDLTYPFDEGRLIPVPGISWSMEKQGWHGLIALVNAAPHRYPSGNSVWNPFPGDQLDVILSEAKGDRNWQGIVQAGFFLNRMDFLFTAGTGVDPAVHFKPNGPLSQAFYYPRVSVAGLIYQADLGYSVFYIESAARYYQDSHLEDYLSTVAGFRKSIFVPGINREWTAVLEIQQEEHLGGKQIYDEMRYVNPLRAMKQALFLNLGSSDINTFDLEGSLGLDGEGGLMFKARFLLHLQQDLEAAVDYQRMDAPCDHYLHVYENLDFIRFSVRKYFSLK